MSKVKAGSAFVEINGDPRKLFAALSKVQRQVGRMGSAFSSVGSKMAMLGSAIAAPFGVAVAGGRRFEDVLLNVRASTGATAAELDQVKNAAMAMSQSLGVGPTEAAQGMLELLKAGMSLQDVLGGAGKVATQFAKVGGMAVADAAVVMADAMNVFKVSADIAANTLSSAADASSTSIEGISLAFSQVSAVAGLANQSIQDTAAALAVLANAGVKGSDAGTSLKTMLMRLMAPADDAVGALSQIGLSVQSFRNADGSMRPMVEIIRTLNDAMVGMDQAAKDDIFRRIFGQDAIRAAAVLTQAGVEGFQAMQDGMAGAMGVGDKYAEMNKGISGAVATLLASLERLAIAVTDAVGPAFMQMANALAPIVSGVTTFVQKNQELVASFVKGTAAAIGIGVALIGIGKAFSLISGTMALVLNPIGATIALVTAAVAALGHFSGAFDGIAQIASTTFQGIYDAIAMGDMAGAMDVLWAGLQAGWLRGVAALMSVVDPWIAGFQNTFTYMGAEIAVIFGSMMSGITQALNTGKAVIMGVVDNIVNGVIASFDAMVATVKKSWNWVQSFIVKGYDLAKENEKVDNEMASRRRQRETSRPGVQGRMEQAAQENAATAAETQATIDFIRGQADQTAQGRLDRNAQLAAERDAAAATAQDRLTGLTRGQSDRRVFRDQADAAISALGSASTMDAVRQLAEEFHLLAQTGQLTAEQQKKYADAVEAAQDRIEGARGEAGVGAAGPVDPKAMQDAAAAASAAQAEVVGTFSAASIGGMGFGQSLQQKANDLLGRIEQNTRQEPAMAVQP